MLLYLIALIGLLLIILGNRYSNRPLVVLGRDIDARSLLAIGAFTLIFVVLMKAFSIA